MQNFQKSCSFDTWLLLFQAQNWGQKTFFGTFVYLWSHATMYFGYYVPWYPGYILELHCWQYSQAYLPEQPLQILTLSLFFSPFSLISPLSHSCLEYALVTCQISSHIKQFLFSECLT